MRTKARFPLRPSRTKPSRLEPHSHFPVGSRLGRFSLRPTHTRSPISKPRCRFCAPHHFPAFLSALPTSTTSRARAATEAPAALLAVPACLGLADLQARMAQLRAACAYSHAIGAEASAPRDVCRATTRLQRDVPRVGQASTPRHESWRARRRYAATIGALTARNEKLAAANTELTAANTNLATKISALSAENSKLAAQCGAVVDATSEALLQEGTARTPVRALSFVCE